MAVVCDQAIPAFCAFESQLKTLCIKDFPCGLGNWREHDVRHQKPKKVKLCSISGKLGKIPQELNITKEANAQQEGKERLQELVGSKFSPWFMDYSWSEEAEELRQISVKSPWLIDSQFVLNHFRTLRIVDKGVTEVDDRLLQLQNLQELTLTANFIQNVSSKHLPQTLQVLELCANEISYIDGLCEQPPPLKHLGLGYNKINFIDDFITADFWPELLSLDLSNNNLTDLLDIVRKLSSLPKLRNLILIGNPLSLIPGYRGYTIDSMRNLSLLDDIRISADEWHHFKGLARRKEYILDEAKVELEVSYLKNVPVPDEVKFADDQPEYPIIERTYYIKFMFLADRGDLSSCMYNLMLDGLDGGGTILDAELPDAASDRQSLKLKDVHQSPANIEKGVLFSIEPDRKVADKPTLPLILMKEAEKTPKSSIQDQGHWPGSKRASAAEYEAIGTEAAKPRVILAPIKSVIKPWAAEIDMDWRSVVTRFDLIALRDFLKQGMEFSVVEEMVQCFPVEEIVVVESPTSSKKSKDGSKDKKDSKGKGKDKKKKKGEEQELRREPPRITTLAVFHISLKEFLEGEYEFSGIFTRDGVEIAPSTARSICSADTKKDKKDSKEKKKDKETPQGKGKDDKKGGKDEKKDGKGKKGATPHASEDNETPLPPPPLEVKVAVRLQHWTTALDSLKEEERNHK